MIPSRIIIDTDTKQYRQQQDQQQEQKDNVANNYNNYYSPAHARAREATTGDQLPPAEIMGRIAQAYRDNISQQITRVAAGIIERALHGGMEPETVILAIEETGMASRPSPYYLSAVLRHWAETGVVVSRARGGAEISTTAARPWWQGR